MTKFNSMFVMAMIVLMPYCQAGEPPKPLAEIANGEKLINRKSTLTDEQHKYMWSATSADRRGYLRIEGNLDYLNLVDAMISHKLHKARLGISSRHGIQQTGTLAEGEFRKTHTFRQGSTSAAVTVFRMRDAGANVTIMDEFINHTVLDLPSTLALVFVPGSSRGLWKLSAWGETSYEVYVQDKFDKEGNPSMSTSEILTLAQELISMSDEKTE